MSVSDPLLKELKGNLVKFLDHVKELNYISDTSSNLTEFCVNIEQILTCGYQYSDHNFGLTKVTYPWFWLNKITSHKHDLITFNYVNAIENVRKHQNILTHVGKLRLLIRCCLQMKSLHVPVAYLMRTKQTNIYYKEYSILGDEILSEIFLSLLLQCSKFNFKLDLTNTPFLSYSWILPEVVKVELVPCASIGMSVSFVDDKAVIVDIQSGSVIAETGKVELGDILDNLNGVHICLATKGKLNSILKNHKSLPVKITIVKSKYSNTNELYEPIIPILRKVKSSVLHFKNNKTNMTAAKKITSAGFKATYVGHVGTGHVGDMNQIDNAVRLLLSPYNNFRPYSDTRYILLRKSVHFEIGEMGVKVIDAETTDVILKHSYMEISSCGSISHLPNYFAYIAGNDHCNVATEFTCHVFHISNSDTACTILQSMGQGFQRTHFVV